MLTACLYLSRAALGRTGDTPVDLTPAPVLRGRTSEVAAQAEAALRTVRIVLGVLAAFVVVGYQPIDSTASWWAVGLTVAAIAATVVGLNLASLRLPQTAPALFLMQMLDVAAVAALTVGLDEPLGHTSWALLVVPVVSASVRLGAAAAAMSWALGTAAYVTAVSVGWAGRPDDLAQLVRVPGTLLAVAITAGLMARWMREGWDIQNELTETISTRERRLAALETAARELKNVSEKQAIQICAERMIALGFDAATAHQPERGDPSIAIGHDHLVAGQLPDDDIEPGSALVTVWTEGDHARSWSVSAREPHTRVVFTGWSSQSVGQELAESFLALVAQTAGAVDAARLVERLRDLANCDPLTGIANRRAFDAELSRHARSTDRLAVALVDMDQFKAINDTHGHLAGDHALIVTSRRLVSAVGADGLVARYGGDELAVLLPGASLDEAEALGRRLLATTREPISIESGVIDVRFSVGIAVAATSRDPADFLAGADRAAYRAKAEGRGQLVSVDLDEVDSQPQPA